LREICQQLVAEPYLNVVAARALARFDDPAVAQRLIEQYGRFREPDRPQVISMLVTRPAFAALLLDAVADGRIPRQDVSAYQVRQLLSLGDKGLADRTEEVWGALRSSDAEKRQRITQLKAQLQDLAPSTSDLSHGRQLFQQVCANCHRLYGQGDRLAPDLTGSGRHNLDYLLENIIDPSAVVDAGFRMKIIVTSDGRVLNGIISAQNERTITVRTQTESVTLQRSAVESVKQTSLSPMPDGLLDNLTQSQVEQLIAYLRNPVQVPLPAD
jgi:putative heme-binding domain-containing protein